jgi:hypothetical protein
MDGNNKPLLLRPSQIFGESWGGYLLRLASANHLSGINQLARLIGLDRKKLLCAQPTSILQKFGVRSTFESLIQDKLTTEDQQETAIRKLGRTYKNRFCPSCLAADVVPYMRVQWERDSLLHCQEHLCMLHTVCEGCKAKVTYQRKDLLRCDCGFELSKTKPVVIPNWISNFYAKLEIEVDHQPITFAIQSESDKTIRVIMKKFVHMVRITDASVFDEDQCLEKVFQNWPSGFQKVANDYVKTTKFQYNQIALNLFGPEGGGEFRELLREMGKTKQAAFMSRKSKDILWLKEKKDDYVSKNNFKKCTGLSENEVLDLIQRNKFDGLIKNEVTYKCVRYAIPKRHIETYARFTSQMSTPKDASLEIGLSEFVIKGLARLNIFAKFTLDGRPTEFRVDPVELSSFARAVTGGGIQNFQDGEELIDASVALAFLLIRAKRHVVTFLKKVLDGDIKKFAHEKSPIYVHDIYFELKEVEGFGLSHRGRPRRKITPEYLYKLENL